MNRLLLLMCIFILFISACSNQQPSAKTTDEAKLSIWLPEWQHIEATEDIKQVASGIDNLHIFAAYFNENDDLFLTENVRKMLQHTQENYANTNKIVLTIVNDYIKADGTSIQKDVNLLKRILKDSTSRNAHISQIIQLVDEHNLDGVEIDYEKIPESYIKKYTSFIQALQKQLKQKGKSLHVIVEPSFPFKTKLPNGPTYAVMAYNVHGYHNGPGPKATYKFLDQLLKKIKNSNQEFTIAFATGGFHWVEDGATTALTEIEAETLLASTGANLKRNKASDAVYFKYVDEANKKHEVWYADQKTLNKWATYVKKRKTKHIMIWRAGGLGQNTLDWMANQ